MKLFQKAIIGVTLLAAFSVHAQEPTKRATKKNSSTVTERDPVIEFKKRNNGVKAVHWKEGRIMIIEKTDGLTEEYRLDTVGEKEKAIKKYGNLPTPPPPPPPAPPIPELPKEPNAIPEALLPIPASPGVPVSPPFPPTTAVQVAPYTAP